MLGTVLSCSVVDFESLVSLSDWPPHLAKCLIALTGPLSWKCWSALWGHSTSMVFHTDAVAPFKNHRGHWGFRVVFQYYSSQALAAVISAWPASCTFFRSITSFIHLSFVGLAPFLILSFLRSKWHIQFFEAGEEVLSCVFPYENKWHNGKIAQQHERQWREEERGRLWRARGRLLGTVVVPGLGACPWPLPSPAPRHGDTRSPLVFLHPSPLAHAVARLLYISKLCGK